MLIMIQFCLVVLLLVNVTPRPVPRPEEEVISTVAPTPAPVSTTLIPAFTFDGVDYDSLPEDLKDEHYNCYNHYNRCIMNYSYFQVVCAIGNDTKYYLDGYYYDAHWWPAPDFVTNCEIELRNCLYREKKQLDRYGRDWVFEMWALPPHWNFEGEGYECDQPV